MAVGFGPIQVLNLKSSRRTFEPGTEKDLISPNLLGEPDNLQRLIEGAWMGHNSIITDQVSHCFKFNLVTLEN